MILCNTIEEKKNPLQKPLYLLYTQKSISENKHYLFRIIENVPILIN